MIEIKSVELGLIRNSELKERATRAQSGRSTEYIAFFNNIEVGLLSYENWSEKSEGFIYEIFILPEYRNNGVGNHFLEFSECKARDLKCKKIILDPNPFDHTVTLEFLISWYEKHGYKKDTTGANKMYKEITLLIDE
ncbi:GNAT family N-acetyltransferase [Providencia rettgeri]|uniref:GNAT family N-acetyltransferase n=1 Tax=Providencia TaxID=586 RepID=UPI001C215764|nr:MULTISPECIES: GNAT family N-acetyltransferase [Providencia]QXB91624.1 GNAT family N-acetyltransferase [Providencia rettgeri]